MHKTNPKISIVIPIYNADRFIRSTIDSCLSQSFDELEIICVNDCSKDNTAAILEEIANKDPRVHCVHHEVNLGEGLARKSGIRASTGKYIMFLDADDSLQPDACRDLYSMMETENVDMIQFGTIVNASDTVGKSELEELYKILMPYPGKIDAENEAGLVPSCFAEHRFAFSIWNKIYRAPIVHQAVDYYKDERFDLAADLYLFFLIAFFSRSYASVSQEYYCYNFGAGVTGGKAITDKIFTGRARINKIVQNLADFCKEKDPIGYSGDAIKDLKKTYASVIVYTLLFQGNELNKAEALKCIFDYYDSADVLGEFLANYHNFGDSRKKELIDLLLDSPVFLSHQGEVKTIGTFYYRLTDGGVERVAALLMDIWCKLGYQVVLFTDELPSEMDYEYPASVTRVIVPKVKDFTALGYRERVAYWQNVIRQYNVDAMVYHAWVSDEIAADILAIKSTHTPMIVHTHGVFAHGMSTCDFQYAYNTVNITRLYKLVDAVITLSEMDYNWWSMFHPRVYKTNNPLTFKLDEITAAPLTSGSLIYVGRLHPEKRVEDCIRILKAVLDSGCETKLQIVGSSDSDEYYSSLQSLADELKVTDHVTFYGYRSDVTSFYQSASVNLLTSASEGFGMTLVEAMVNGVPSVVYNLPNVDLVQKRKGIRVVPQGDVKGAAREIVRLLTEDGVLEAEGKAARESVEEAFSASIPKFWQLVFENVGAGKAPAPCDPNYERIRTAVTLLVENYLSGVEKRHCMFSDVQNVSYPEPYVAPIIMKKNLIDKWTDRFPGDVDSDDITVFPGDRVMAMYQDGSIGLKYLVRFFVAWIKVKVFGKRKHTGS